MGSPGALDDRSVENGEMKRDDSGGGMMEGLGDSVGGERSSTNFLRRLPRSIAFIISGTTGYNHK